MNCLSIKRCQVNRIAIIERSGNVSCLPCARCQEGLEPTIACGSAVFKRASVSCQPCKPGTFSVHHDHEGCKPCKTCSKHQTVLSECTSTSNTICGKCGKGFYQDNSVASDCLPCSECCMNGTSTDDTIEECTQSGLPPNRHCKFHKAKSCQTKCGIQQNIIPISGSKGYTYKCADCPVCPAGWGASVPCGGVLDSYKPRVECHLCVRGETFSDGYNSEYCKPCTICGFGREEKQNCTPTQDTVCGACKPGFYSDAFTTMCHECSWCCSDDKDIIEAQCLTQGMPAEKRCKRNLRSVNECYKLNLKSKSNSTTEANLNNESHAHGMIVGLTIVLNFIAITVIISTILCWKYFPRRKTYKHDYFNDLTIEKIKVPSALGATKLSLQVKTTATGKRYQRTHAQRLTQVQYSRLFPLFIKTAIRKKHVIVLCISNSTARCQT